MKAVNQRNQLVSMTASIYSENYLVRPRWSDSNSRKTSKLFEIESNWAYLPENALPAFVARGYHGTSGLCVDFDKLKTVYAQDIYFVFQLDDYVQPWVDVTEFSTLHMNKREMPAEVPVRLSIRSVTDHCVPLTLLLDSGITLIHFSVW